MTQSILSFLAIDPGDSLAWLALADALEEDGQVDRAELTRLTLHLRDCCVCPECETRLHLLLRAGVLPCVPTITNSVGMKLGAIPPGRFMMGSPMGDKDRYEDEQRHEVEISRPFYMGVYPVTQEEYEAVMGTNPSYFKGKRLPVERVSWNDAVEFCKKLSERPAEKKAGRKYRLPTEAEWEYACRAGTSTDYNTGTSLPALGEAGWYAGNGGDKTHEVGQKKGNAWGLYDMHGNVWEWCSDRYDANYYVNSPSRGPATPRRDPSGPAHGSPRVLRGGSWGFNAWRCRSASRYSFDPVYRYYYLGFRVALSMCTIG